MTQSQPQDPPIVEVVKNGYVRIYDEEWNPIDLPVEHALAIAAGIDARRDEIEQNRSIAEWQNVVSQATGVVASVRLSGPPKLEVERYRFATERCLLQVADEDDLHLIAAEYDAPVCAEFTYSTAHQEHVNLFTYVGAVKVVYRLMDPSLGALLVADAELVSS